MDLKVDLIKAKIKESISSQGLDHDLISINQRLRRLRNQSKNEKIVLKTLFLFVVVFGWLKAPAQDQYLKVEGKISIPTENITPENIASETPKKLKINKTKLVKKKILLSPYKSNPTLLLSPYKRGKDINKEAPKLYSFPRFLMQVNPIGRKKLKVNIVELLEAPYPITSEFGLRKDPIRSKGRKLKIKIYKYHNGIDIGVPVGTPIHSPADAIVSEIHYKSCSGGGKKIYLDHYNGYQTVYMHLSRIIIQEGQYIKKGQLIGYTGMSGFRVTGPHLHFEVKKDGKHLNPHCFMEN